MKKFVSVVLFCLSVVFFNSELSAQKANRVSSIPSDANFWSDYPNEELADFLISKMTDEEMLAQIFMFGWAGEEPSALLNQWVCDRGLGSVKVFGWNTDNTEKVAKAISMLQQGINGIEYLNTSSVTNMSEMFVLCEKLTSIDLSHFDTRNVA
ncbi:MAG: BspA family leucine-rich repeat surface protein, partial [Treponema sp.]|uniref:BspA family leucine-rich repeat surface protein n=1 Tax=Treponema sp. TaxID=166 RepID=UPI0025F37455